MGASCVPITLLQSLTVVSTVALIVCLLGAVHIYSELSEFSTSVDEKMNEFTEFYDYSWQAMVNTHPVASLDGIRAIFSIRPKRQTGSGCNCAKSPNNCPRGPPGEKGATGFSGQNGQDGMDGPDGNRYKPQYEGAPGSCIQCPAGPIGPPGAMGERGQRGNKGPEGMQGRPGKNGLRGAVGAVGDKGPIGPMGQKGSAGNPGLDAISGKAAPGVKGARGPRGKAGPQGVPGKDGEEGPAGSVGQIGKPGLRGKDGERGEQGEAGGVGVPGPDRDYCPCPSKSGVDHDAHQPIHDAAMTSGYDMPNAAIMKPAASMPEENGGYDTPKAEVVKPVLPAGAGYDSSPDSTGYGQPASSGDGAYKGEGLQMPAKFVSTSLMDALAAKGYRLLQRRRRLLRVHAN